MARANGSGCTILRWTPNRNRPQRSVAARLYTPTVARPSVAGSRTSAKCRGAATRSSSVPHQRSRCIAEPAEVLTDDHMPITAAPKEA